MKLLVFVLSALLVISCVSQADSENNCQELDPSQLETDPLLRDAFDQGLKWLFQQASDKYDISYSDIQVTQVNRICHWQVGNDIYNIFDVEVTNNEDANIKAVFIVNCKDDDSAPPAVIKWNYDIQYENNSGENFQAEAAGQDVEVGIDVEIVAEEFGEFEEIAEPNSESNCQELDSSQLETDPLLRDAFDQGIKWIFRHAANEYDISYENIEVTQVNRICHWQVGNNIYNIFDVQATNNMDANIHAVFVVDCKDDDSAPPAVVRWKIDIEYTTESNEIVEVETANEETELGQNIEIEIETDAFE